MPTQAEELGRKAGTLQVTQLRGAPGGTIREGGRNVPGDATWWTPTVVLVQVASAARETGSRDQRSSRGLGREGTGEGLEEDWGGKGLERDWRRTGAGRGWQTPSGQVRRKG